MVPIVKLLVVGHRHAVHYFTQYWSRPSTIPTVHYTPVPRRMREDEQHHQRTRTMQRAALVRRRPTSTHITVVSFGPRFSSWSPSLTPSPSRTHARAYASHMKDKGEEGSPEGGGPL